MKKIIFFGGLFFLIINIFLVKDSLAAVVKVTLDTSKDYVPGQTYNVSWESECKGGYVSVWFSTKASTTAETELLFPLTRFSITPILQGMDSDYSFSNGFNFNSVYALNPNRGTLDWRVPSQGGFYSYSFGSYPYSYYIYRSSNGKYTVIEQNTSPMRLLVFTGDYVLRVDIKGADCSATGQSDLFHVVASPEVPTDAKLVYFRTPKSAGASTTNIDVSKVNKDVGIVNGSEITVSDPTDLSGKNNLILHFEAWGENYYHAQGYCQLVKKCTGYKDVKIVFDNKYACRCDTGQFGCTGESCINAMGVWSRITSLTCTGCPIGNNLALASSTPSSSAPGSLNASPAASSSSQITPTIKDTPKAVVAPVKPSSSVNKISSADAAFTKKQAGKILLQVESKGEAWYVNPKNSQRYYLANGNDAYQIMKTLGIGISNKDFDKVKSDANFRKKFIGQILLQVESHGEAYYISSNNRYNYLKDGAAAYQAMRSFGLGITNSDLKKIPAVAGSTVSSSSTSAIKLETGVESACSGNSKCLKYKSVEISWQLDPSSFSEDMQPDGVATYSGTALEEKDSPEMIKIVKTALDKYPEGLLKRYLSKVYLLGNMSYGSSPMLGTIDKLNRHIYLRKSDQAEKIEQALHHELAHLIYFNKNIYLPDFETDWAKINPVGFAYQTNFIDSVATNDTNAFSQDLGNQGFLSLYAQNNFKEDFAVMAMNMFKQAPLVLKADFWSTVDNFPKIKEKFNLILKFYQEINSVFTAEYFRQVSKL